MIQHTNGIDKFILVMVEGINLGGLHTTIPSLNYKPATLEFVVLLLAIINDLFKLKRQKQTERKLKLIFMKYIGGQNKTICWILKLPLIYSAEKKKLCRCGKKESFKCSELNCRICFCKSCADNVPKIFILLLILLQFMNYKRDQMWMKMIKLVFFQCIILFMERIFIGKKK